MSDAPAHSAFLASAIAGRRVAVYAHKEPQAHACSDGQNIFIPPRHFNNWRVVAAQATLLATDALQPNQLTRLLGRREAIKRYTFLEVQRACRILQPRLPTALLSHWDIDLAYDYSHSAAESVELALGQSDLPDTPEEFGQIRPLMTLRQQVSSDGLRALTSRQQEGRIQLRPQQELTDDDEHDSSSLLKAFQNPLSGGGALTDWINKLLGAGTTGRNETQGDDASGDGVVSQIQRSLRKGVNASLAALPLELPEISLQHEAQLSYPEWDTHKQQFRPHWVMVEDVEAWNPNGLRDIQHLLSPPSKRLRHQLASLGLNHEFHRRQVEGSELDTGRLVEHAIDLRSGFSADPAAVYLASRRTRRDLAVSIVMDLSGSTAKTDETGQSVFDRQLQLAYRLTRGLNDLGDTVGLFGFHSWGRKLVRMVWIKGHQERWNMNISNRLAQLEPVGYTRLGAAIRHVDHNLREHVRLPNRLMLLITDGFAYDQGYEARYAEGDTRKALEQARANGTAVVCLCLGGDGDTKTLRKIFGSSYLIEAEQPELLSSKIGRLSQIALDQASRS